MREYHELAALLKAFVLEEEYLLPEKELCGRVLELSKIHGVYSIASYMILQGLPDANRGLKLSCVNVYAHMALKTDQMGALGILLADNQIDYLPFKGYIVREYYPVPELRTFGDVDFLIRKEDRKKCHELLLANGFILKKGWEPAYTYTKGISTFEIHTELLETEISGRLQCRGFFAENPWQHALQRSDHFYVFDSEYHFVYLLTHIAKHISGSGAGCRMYLDLAVFIKNGRELDWKWILETLKGIGLWTFAVYALTLVQEYFGVEIPVTLPEIAEQDFEEFFSYTMEAGVFGFENRDSGAVVLKNRKSGDGRLHRGRTIFRIMFPAAKTIAPRYTYLQRRPWMLPIAWVHRLILTKKNIRAHIKKAEKIAGADAAEVERLEKIKSNLGF